MKTVQRTNIPSPIQLAQREAFNISNPQHPVREEIRKNIGTYNLTAEFAEDTDALATFKHVPGLVAFSCTLKRDGHVVGRGVGRATLSRTNRYVERAVRAAFNASLVDAVVCAKMLDSLCVDTDDEDRVFGDVYKQRDTGRELITDRQKSYLLELIDSNVFDEEAKDEWIARIGALTKEEASEAISSFVQ